jgi:DNA-directed RNA polymerase subunit alpha
MTSNTADLPESHLRIRWRDMELPTSVRANPATLTPSYGEFTVEPFERGFGDTVGNGLRRILLSSIEGAAFTSCRVKGAQHEFTSLKGVYEDVTYIVLNLKRVRVKYTGNGVKTISLEASKPGPITAGMFQTDATCSIENPDLVICNLTEPVKLQIDATIKRGRGYRTAEENTEEDMPHGTIPMASVFSPVLRCRYTKEATRVGKMTNYDRLKLEVWTNGTIDPGDSIVEAARIFRKHLNPFLLAPVIGPALPTGEGGVSTADDEGISIELREKLAQPVSVLELSLRSRNCLEAEQIKTVGELVARTEGEMLKIRNFGKTSLTEIGQKLAAMGLSLGMNVTEEAPAAPAPAITPEPGVQG